MKLHRLAAIAAALSSALPLAACAPLRAGDGRAEDAPDASPVARHVDTATLDAVAAAAAAGDAYTLARWRQLPAYQALAAALPGEHRQAALARVDLRLQRATAADLDAARTVAHALAARLAQLDGFLLPHLETYLPSSPRARARLGRVLLVPFLREATEASFLATRTGDVLVDPAAPELAAAAAPDAADAAAALAESLAERLYRAALARELPDPPRLPPADAASLEQALLHAIQVEGMTSWVLSQGRALAVLDDAGRAPLAREVAVSRFQALEEALRELDDRAGPSETRTRWRVIEARAAATGAYPVIGAYVASIVEAAHGRSALIATIRPGGHALWRAYEATAPGATLWFRLPTDRPAERAATPPPPSS